MALWRTHALGGRGDGPRDRVSVVTLEPRHKSIHARVHLTPIAVAIWGQGEVFYDRFVSWLVCKGEFPRSFLASTEEVWYSLGVLSLLLTEQLL